MVLPIQVGTDWDEAFVREEHRLEAVTVDVVEESRGAIQSLLHLTSGEELATTESVASLVETEGNLSNRTFADAQSCGDSPHRDRVVAVENAVDPPHHRFGNRRRRSTASCPFHA